MTCRKCASWEFRSSAALCVVAFCVFTLHSEAAKEAPHANTNAAPVQKADSQPVRSSVASPRETGQCKVYSNSPPEIAGVDFKPVTLRQTELTRLGTLNCALFIGEDSEIHRGHTTGYISTRSKVDESDYHVRVQLRTMTGKPVISNLSVVVQYFVRPAVRSSGKNPPKQHSAAIARIARLGSKPLTVAFPPKSIYKAFIEQHSEHAPHVCRETGSEFYGVLVSVVDANDALIFQASSNSSLDDFGRTTIAEFRKNRIEADIEIAKRELSAAQSDYYSQMNDAAAKQRLSAAQKRLDELRRQLPK